MYNKKDFKLIENKDKNLLILANKQGAPLLSEKTLEPVLKIDVRNNLTYLDGRLVLLNKSISEIKDMFQGE